MRPEACRRRPGPLCAAATIGMLCLAAFAREARPQELDAQIQEIRTLLREKRYPLALEGLRFVARRVQDLRAAEIRPAFPAAPAGWRVGDPFALAHEEDVWERRLEVRASYLREDGGARIDVTVDLNSPLAPLAALELNPVVVAADPRVRVVDVAGRPGRLRFNPDTGSAELRVILDGRSLLTVSGRGLGKGEDLLELARAVDFVLLAKRAGI